MDEPSGHLTLLKKLTKIAGLSLDIAVVSIMGIVILIYNSTIRAGFDSPISDPTNNSFWGGLHEGIQLMFCIGSVLGIYAILRLTLHSAILTEWLVSKAKERREDQSFLFYILTALPTIALWLFAFWGGLFPLWGFIALTATTVLCIVFSSWGMEFEDEPSRELAKSPPPETTPPTSQKLKVSNTEDLSVVLARFRHLRNKEDPASEYSLEDLLCRSFQHGENPEEPQARKEKHIEGEETSL